MNLMDVSHVSKTYRYQEKQEGLKGSLRGLFHRKTLSRDALSDFSFTMEEGEFVGLMGPNGAGKTTLIKILTGIIHPTKGEVRIMGFDPAKGEDAFKKQFAVVMGQKSQLWWDLPAGDSFLLNKAIYDVPESRYRENIRYYSRLFQVESLLQVPVRNLSLGERMKMEVIASLMHDPKCLFLDEPTIGLDAVAQRQIREMLHQAGRERGISLLLTSHYTEDLLDLTPRVMVIRTGSKVYDGPLDSLLRSYSANHTITVRFASHRRPDAPEHAELVSQTDYETVLRVGNGQVQATLRHMLDLGEIEDIRVEDDDVTLLVERVYQNA